VSDNYCQPADYLCLHAPKRDGDKRYYAEVNTIHLAQENVVLVEAIIKTSRQLFTEGDHGETYDGPVIYVAVLLLEANRRKRMHGKPETNGAREVERHGHTSN